MQHQQELLTLGISNKHISKQLKYITKDHIAMCTILFELKMVLFFSSLVM